jgi:hypothetical protein
MATTCPRCGASSPDVIDSCTGCGRDLYRLTPPSSTRATQTGVRGYAIGTWLSLAAATLLIGAGTSATGLLMNDDRGPADAPRRSVPPVTSQNLPPLPSPSPTPSPKKAAAKPQKPDKPKPSAPPPSESECDDGFEYVDGDINVDLGCRGRDGVEVGQGTVVSGGAGNADEPGDVFEPGEPGEPGDIGGGAGGDGGNNNDIGGADGGAGGDTDGDVGNGGDGDNSFG